MEDLELMNVTYEDSIEMDNKYLIHGAVSFRANLSDIIDDIEMANLYDIPQLLLEVILTCLCLGGNFLTITVLRHAARKHPAQALRLDAAPLGTILYASFWFGMSSSFFNFLLYNIRIPAFRKASWELITSVKKDSKIM